MANIRQYIGARYTIKIYENSQDASSAEWEANTSYEPLVMVTYNNSSYLSKKDVPATIGNPAQNPLYWIVTGAYNGQIASLQSQIDTINNTTIPGLSSDIDDVEALANKKDLKMSEKVFLFVSDSYDVTTNFISKVGASIGCASYTKRSETGAGFYKYGTDHDNLTYYNILTSLDPLTDSEKANITDVCFCVAVGNDYPNDANLTAALTTMNTYLRANLPKLDNIYLIPLGWACNSSSIQERIKTNLDTYSHTVNSLGWKYIDCTRVMKSGLFIDYASDPQGYHPSNVGGTYMADCVINAILTGSCSWSYLTEKVLDVTADLTSVGGGASLSTPIKFNVAIRPNGDIAVKFNYLFYSIWQATVASGTTVYDIPLTISSGENPFPITTKLIHPLVAFGISPVQSAVLFRSNDTTFKLRIYTDGTTATGDITIVGSEFIMPY